MGSTSPLGLLHPGTGRLGLDNEAWELRGLQVGMSWPSPFSLTRPFGHRLGSCVAGVTRGLRGGLPHHTRVWAWGKSVLRPGLQA